MNSSSKGGGGFDPELARKIEALEKQETRQRRCPHCGVASTTKRVTCENCGNYFERGVEKTVWDTQQGMAKAVLMSEEEEQLAALKSYLVKRVLAKVIDTFIVGSLVALLYMTYFGLAHSLDGMPQFAPALLTCFYWWMPSLAIICLLGYPAAFEASPIQATPGKLVMGLYVVDTDDKPCRAEPLVYKAFLGHLPTLGFGGVYLYFFMTKFRLNSPLDAVSTAVLAISGVAFFVTFLAMHIIMGSEKKRQTITDLLAGIVVMERK